MKKFLTVPLFLFCLILVNPASVKAQAWQWAKSWGGLNNDAGRVISTDAAGNVIVAGGFFASSINIGTLTLTNAGGGDIYLAKFSPQGNVIWAQNIGGPGLDIVGGVCTGTNGNIYISGSYDGASITLSNYNLTQNSSAGNDDMFIACYSPSGSALWAYRYGSTGNEQAGKLVYSEALSSLFFTGYFNGTSFSIGTSTLTNASSSTYDMFLARFNSSGIATWAVRTGSANANDYGLEIDIDASNNVYIGGTFSPVTGGQSFIGATVASYGSQDVFVAKYNSSGTFQWVRTAGTSNGTADYLLGLTVDAANNCYISGHYFGSTMTAGTTTLPNSGSFDGFLLKYNSAGTVQWGTSLSGTASENLNAVTTDSNNNVYVAGSFASPTLSIGSSTIINSGNSDVIVVKYNSSGVSQWAAKATSTAGETAYGAASDAIGNLYVTGSFNINDPISFAGTSLASNGGNDAFLSKIGCATAIISGPASVCAGSSVTLTASGAATYTWSNGSTGSSIVVSPASSASYSVNGSNGSCNATPANHSISVLPASLVTPGTMSLFCGQQQQINITSNPAAVSASWSPTINLSNSTAISPSVTAPSSPVNYSVTATLSNGCILTRTVSVFSTAPAPDICLVTSDSLGINNEIFWDKSAYPMMDSMIVLRQTSTNIYKRIGAVSKNAPGVFADTARSVGPSNGDPNISTYRYKLQMRDSCGNYSQPGLWHNTVYFTNSNGTFFWVNNYMVEGNPLPLNPVINYSLMVCINPTISPNYMLVGVTSGNQNSLTDPSYASYQATADWRVEANLGYECDAGLRTASPLVKATKSRSNIQNNRLMSISEQLMNGGFKIFPNPAKNTTVVISGNNYRPAEIIITDVCGRTIQKPEVSGRETVIDLQGIASGVYFISLIRDGKLSGTQKLIVE